MNTDAGSALKNWLETSAKAAAIRALVYGDILESGDLKASELSAKDIERSKEAVSDPTVLNQILYLMVHQGASVARDDFTEEQQVVVRLIDRGQGYANIRAVRDRLRRDLIDWHAMLDDVDGGDAGILSLEWRRSTGHLQSADFAADFEALTYVARIFYEE